MVSKSQFVQKLTRNAASSFAKDKILSEHTGSGFKLLVNVADRKKACSKALTFKPNPGLEGLNLSLLQKKTLNKCAYASKKQPTKFSVSYGEWTQSISNDQWAQFLGDQSLNNVELSHLSEKQGVYAESYEKDPSKLYGVGASHQGIAAFEPGLIRQFNAELIKDKELSSHDLYAIAQNKVAQSEMIQGNQAELIPVTCEQHASATKGSLVISCNEGEVTAPAPAAHSLVSLEFKFAYEALAGIEMGHTSLGALINQQLELTLGQFVSNAVILQELDKRLQARQQIIDSNTANTANAVNAGISNAKIAHLANISETVNTAESKQVEDGAAQVKDQTITTLASATASTTVTAITANAPAEVHAQAKVEIKTKTKGGIESYGDKSKAKVSACCSAADVDLEAELALAALADDTTITVFPFPASALQASTQNVTLTVTTLTLAPNSAHAVADTAYSLEAATRSTLPNTQREEQSKDTVGNLEHLMSLVRFTQLQAARLGFFELRAVQDKVKLSQAVQAANVDYASHGKAVAYISDQAHIKDPKQVQTKAQVCSLSQSSLADQVPVQAKLQAQVKTSDYQLFKPHLSTQSNFSNLRAQYQFLQSVHENTGKSQSLPLQGSLLANATSSAQATSCAKAVKSIAIKAPFISQLCREQSAQSIYGAPYGSPCVAQQGLQNGTGKSLHAGLSKVQQGLCYYARQTYTGDKLSSAYAPGSKFEDEAMVAVAQALESLACLSKGRRVIQRKSEFEELAADILEDYDTSREPRPYKRKRNNNCVVKPVRMCLLQLVPMYTLQGDILSNIQGCVSLTFELPANISTNANLSNLSSLSNFDKLTHLSNLSAHESVASHISNSKITSTLGLTPELGIAPKVGAATVLGSMQAVSSAHALVASQALELTSSLGLANVFSVAQVLCSTKDLTKAFTSSSLALSALALREKAYSLPLTASFLKQIFVQSQTELTAIREKQGVSKIEPFKDETVALYPKAQSQSCAFKSRVALLGQLINNSATWTGRDHSDECGGKSALGGAANAAHTVHAAFSRVRLLPTKDSTLELPETLRHLLEPEISYQRTLTYLEENDILTKQQSALPKRLSNLTNELSHINNRRKSKADAKAKAKDNANVTLGSLRTSGIPCSPDMPKISASNLICEADSCLDGACQHDICQQDTYHKKISHEAVCQFDEFQGNSDLQDLQAVLRAVPSRELNTPSEQSVQSGRNEVDESSTLGAQGSLGTLGQQRVQDALIQQNAQGQAEVQGLHYQKQSLGLSLLQSSLVFGNMSLLEPGDEVRTEQLVALLRHYHEVKQQKLYALEQVQREATIKSQSRRAVVEIAMNQPGQFHPHHIMPDVQQFCDGLKPTVVSPTYVQQLTNACNSEDEALLNQSVPEQPSLQQTQYLQGLAAAQKTVSTQIAAGYKTLSSYDGSTQHILANIGYEAQDELMKSSNFHSAQASHTSHSTQFTRPIQSLQQIQSSQKFQSVLLTQGLHESLLAQNSHNYQAAYAPKSVQNFQEEQSSQEVLSYPVAKAQSAQEEWAANADKSFQTALSAMPAGLGNDSPLAMGLEQDYATLQRLEAYMDLDDPEVHTENLTLSKTFDFTVMACVLGSDIGPALDRLQKKVNAVIQVQALRQAKVQAAAQAEAESKVQAQANAKRLNVELVNAQGLTAISVTPRNLIRQSVVGQSFTHAFTQEQDAHEHCNLGQGNSAYTHTPGGSQPQVEVVTQHDAKFIEQPQFAQLTQESLSKSTTPAQLLVQPLVQIQSQLKVNSHVNSHALLSALSFRSYGVMFEGVAELAYHDLPLQNEKSVALFSSLKVSQAEFVTTLNSAFEKPMKTPQDNLVSLANQVDLLVVQQNKTAKGNKFNECHDAHAANEVIKAYESNDDHKADYSELADAYLVESTESPNQVDSICDSNVGYEAKWSADFNSELDTQVSTGATMSGANADCWFFSDPMATGKFNLLAADVILNSSALDMLSGSYANGSATASQDYVRSKHARTYKITPLGLSIANAYMQGTKQLIDESSQQSMAVGSTALASTFNISLDTAPSLSQSCADTCLIHITGHPDLKAEHPKHPSQVEQNEWNASNAGSEDQFGVNDQALGVEWANAAKLANAMSSTGAHGEDLGNEIPIAVDLTHEFNQGALKDKLNSVSHELLQRFKDAVKAVVEDEAEQNELLENLELEPVTMCDAEDVVINLPCEPADVFNERLLKATLYVNTQSTSNIYQSSNGAVGALGTVELEDRIQVSKITGPVSELDAAIQDGFALFNWQQDHADLVLERVDSKVISPRAAHFEQVGHAVFEQVGHTLAVSSALILQDANTLAANTLAISTTRENAKMAQVSTKPLFQPNSADADKVAQAPYANHADNTVKATLKLNTPYEVNTPEAHADGESDFANFACASNMVNASNAGNIERAGNASNVEHADNSLVALTKRQLKCNPVASFLLIPAGNQNSHAVFSSHQSTFSPALPASQSYSQAPVAAEGYMQMLVRCESARKYYQVDVPYNSYQADCAGLTNTEQPPALASTVNPFAKVSFDNPMALLDAALLFSKEQRFSDISHQSAVDDKLCAPVAEMPGSSDERSDIRTKQPERNEHNEGVSASWISGLALDSAKLRVAVRAKAFTGAALSSVEGMATENQSAYVSQSVLASTLNSHLSAQASQAPYAVQAGIHSPNLDAQPSSIQFVCDPESNVKPSSDCSLIADSAMPHVALSAKDALMLLSDGVRSYNQRAYPMPEFFAHEGSLVAAKGARPDNIRPLAKDNSLAGLINGMQESAGSPLRAITQLAGKLEPETKLEPQTSHADLQNWDNLPGFIQDHAHIHAYPLTYAHAYTQVLAQTHITTQSIVEHDCPDILALPAQACPIVQVSSSWTARCQAEVESVMGVEHAAVISELKETAQVAADAILVTLNEEQAAKPDSFLETHAELENLHEAVLQIDATSLSQSPASSVKPTVQTSDSQINNVLNSYLSTSLSDDLELSHSCDTNTVVAHENLARAPKTFYADKLSDSEREQLTQALASRLVESGFMIQVNVGLQDESAQEIGLDFGDAPFAYKLPQSSESIESIESTDSVESTGIPEVMPDKTAQVKTKRMQVASPEPYDQLAHKLIKPPNSQELTDQSVQFSFNHAATSSHFTQTPRSSAHFQSAHNLFGANPAAIFNTLSKFTELLHASRNCTQYTSVESKSNSWSESERLSAGGNKTVSQSGYEAIPSLMSGECLGVFLPQVNKQQCAAILNSVNHFSKLLQAASSASQNSIQSWQMDSKSQSARDAGAGAGAVTGGRWRGLKAKFASMWTALGRERGTRLTLEVARPESDLVHADVSDMHGGQRVVMQGDSAASLSEEHLYISLLADEMEHPFDGGGWTWLEQPWVNLTAEHQPLAAFEVCMDAPQSGLQLLRSNPDHEQLAAQKREHFYAQRAKSAKQFWFKNNWMTGEEAVSLVSGFAVPTPAPAVQKVGAAAKTLAQEAGANADAYAIKADQNLGSAELHFDPSLTRRWTECERGYANLSWGLGGADAAMSLGMFQTNHDYYQSFMTQAAIAYKQSSLIVDNWVSLWQAKLTRTYFDLQQATLGGMHLAQNLGLAQKLELSWFSSLSFVPECAETIKYMCQSCNQSPYQKAAQHLCGLVRDLEQRDYFDVLQANTGVPASFEVLGR